MHPSIRIPRWAVGLALASACVLVATAQVAPAPVAPAADAPVVDDIPFASPNPTAVTVPSATERLGRPAHRQRGNAVRPRGELQDPSHARSGEAHHRRQAATHLAQPQRPPGARRLPAPVPQRVRGPGQHLQHREAQQPFGFRSDVETEEGGCGYTRLQRGRAGRRHRAVVLRASRRRPVDRPHRRAPRPAGSRRRGRHAPRSTSDFFDQLPRVSARTGYFGTFHLVGQWFPKIGVLELPGERGATAPRWNVHEFHLHSEFYADYGQYDVSHHRAQGLHRRRDRRTDKARRSNASGTVTHRYVQGDVHDFAWTADNRYAKPLDGVYNGANGPVKVRVLYHPEYATNAQAGAGGDDRIADVFLRRRSATIRTRPSPP